MADAPATTSQLSSAAASKEPSRASTPANAPVEKAPDEGSKLKTFLGVLRRFIGVSDLAAVRFSLPAQLLEPTPNLGMSAACLCEGVDKRSLADGEQSTGTTWTGQKPSSASATRTRPWAAC
jgi:hypothetical protein